jgi:hypothetical protein
LNAQVGEALGDLSVSLSTPLITGLSSTEFIRLFLDQVRSLVLPLRLSCVAVRIRAPEP